MSVKDLALAIATSDVKALSKIKGLGKKTAERIIVELRESVSNVKDDSPLVSAIPMLSSSSDGENAVMALMSLGYNKITATRAVENALTNGAKSVEDIIANALRSLA